MNKFDWSVINVVPRKDFKLILTFASGEEKIFDGKKLFCFKTHEALKNYEFFKKAHVAYNTVVWNEDIDAAPEYLYENSVEID